MTRPRYTYDSTGTVYRDDVAFLTIHPGQGDVAFKAWMVANALNSASFDPMKTPLMMAD